MAVAHLQASLGQPLFHSCQVDDGVEKNGKAAAAEHTTSLSREPSCRLSGVRSFLQVRSLYHSRTGSGEYMPEPSTRQGTGTSMR
eukprot:229307-Amphidinium_carterae.1